MPKAKDSNCGLWMHGIRCDKPAHHVEGCWFPLQNFGQIWFFCDEHWEIRDKIRTIYGDGYAHDSQKI